MNTTVRIYAMGSPFETKDLLKARGYRWGAGDDGKPKAWWCEVNEAARDAEIEFLHAHIYGGRPRQLPEERLDATLRYSTRV